MLKGFASFVRQNPKSDIISANTFHHLDFYCTDATNLYKRFMIGLGMNLVAKSDQSTGNHVYASYVLRSNDMTMVFTAPYSNNNQTTTALPFTSYNQATANQFSLKHGTGVQAVSVVVDDLFASIDAMVKNGAEVRVPPTTITDKFGNGDATIAEVLLYGDVHLRLVDAKNFHGSFLPNYQDVPLTDRALPFSIASATPTIGSMTQSSSSIGKKDSTYGLKRFDHVVGNLWSLEPRKSQIQRMTVSTSFAVLIAYTTI